MSMLLIYSYIDRQPCMSFYMAGVSRLDAEERISFDDILEVEFGSIFTFIDILSLWRL